MAEERELPTVMSPLTSAPIGALAEDASGPGSRAARVLEVCGLALPWTLDPSRRPPTPPAGEQAGLPPAAAPVASLAAALAAASAAAGLTGLAASAADLGVEAEEVAEMVGAEAVAAAAD